MEGVHPADMTQDQRLAALKRANDVRSARAMLKKDLKDKRVRIAEVLFPAIENYLETMRVLDLLVACPKIGRVKGNRICNRLAVRPSLYLSQLSQPRRQQLVEAVEGSGHSRSG